MEYSFNKFYRKWAIATSVVNLVCLIVALRYDTHLPWVIGVMFLFGVYLGRIRSYLPVLPMMIGYANWVSLFRLLIIAILFTFCQQLGNVELFIGFLIAIAMDGVDGYLARRFGHASEAGGQFDMEIDACLVLILSWIQVSQNHLHWFILIPGAFRYIYEVFLFWIPNRKAEILPKKVRSTIAVSFFISLLIPFLTLLPSLVMLVYISGVLIVISFTVSLYSQLRKDGNIYSHS